MNKIHYNNELCYKNTKYSISKKKQITIIKRILFIQTFQLSSINYFNLSICSRT